MQEVDAPAIVQPVGLGATQHIAGLLVAPLPDESTGQLRPGVRRDAREETLPGEALRIQERAPASGVGGGAAQQVCDRVRLLPLGTGGAREEHHPQEQLGALLEGQREPPLAPQLVEDGLAQRLREGEDLRSQSQGLDREHVDAHVPAPADLPQQPQPLETLGDRGAHQAHDGRTRLRTEFVEDDRGGSRLGIHVREIGQGRLREARAEGHRVQQRMPVGGVKRRVSPGRTERELAGAMRGAGGEIEDRRHPQRVEHERVDRLRDDRA